MRVILIGFALATLAVPSGAQTAAVDIYGDMATVKLSSTRLIDYLHLVRWNGEWKIVNVLWAPGPESK